MFELEMIAQSHLCQAKNVNFSMQRANSTFFLLFFFSTSAAVEFLSVSYRKNQKHIHFLCIQSPFYNSPPHITPRRYTQCRVGPGNPWSPNVASAARENSSFLHGLAEGNGFT